MKTKPQVEIFQLDVDNLRCGWCQAYLANDIFMGHANQHLLKLEEMREASRLTITVKLPDPEEDPFNVEEL
jgi:hypothetical protein